MSHWWDSKKQRWRWGVDLQLGGKRFRPTKLLPKGWRKDQAAKYDRITTERLIAEASGVQPATHLIDTAVSAYLDEVVPTLRTGANIAQELTHLIDYIEGRPFSDLPDVFITYAQDNRHLAPATVRNRLAYLRAACRYAYKYKKIGDADSLGRLSMPVVNNTRTTRIDDAGFATLIGKMAREDAAFITLAYYTALRLQKEIHKLTRANVRHIGKEVWLECGKTKNGEPHMVPVYPDAVWAVDFIPFKKAYRDYYDALKAAHGRNRPARAIRVRHAPVVRLGGAFPRRHDRRYAGRAEPKISKLAAERYAHMDLTRKKAIFGRFPSHLRTASAVKNRKSARKSLILVPRSRARTGMRF